MKSRLAPLAAVLLFPFIAGTIWVVLDQVAAYRSPVLADEPDRTPRLLAKERFQQWLLDKAEAEHKRAELLANLDVDTMVQLGKEIVHGRGLCFNCHSIGSAGGGTQGPNLEGVGQRAGSRVEGLTDLEYLAQSLYQPQAFVVPGYSGTMTAADTSPISLDEIEILMVVSYLQTLGGTVSVTPETKLPYSEGQ